MPSGHDWGDLLRSTFRDVGREDISGLYSLGVEARQGEADRRGRRRDRAASRKRLKRCFKTTNSVLFGLSKRLAPRAPRRVSRRARLLLPLDFLAAPSSSTRRRKRTASAARRRYKVDFDSGFLGAAAALLTLLLGMELVDKINFRDELELARDAPGEPHPEGPSEDEPYEIGAHNEIANMVGGDIYDFVPLPDGRLAVLFGDASGHGMAAGLVMAVAHAAFRTQLDVDPSPAAMFATLNRILCRTGSPRAFFGCVYLMFTPDGAFTAAIAGHPQPLASAPTAPSAQRFGAGAYPLGIKVQTTWPVEPGAPRDRRDAAAAPPTASPRRATPPGATSATRGSRRPCAPRSRCRPRRSPRRSPRDVQAHRGPGAPEDDVSIAVLRRIG